MNKRDKRVDKPQDRAAETAQMSEREKAYAGEWYRYAFDRSCKDVTERSWSSIPKLNELARTDKAEATRQLVELCPGISQDVDLVFPIVAIDYCDRIFVGRNTFINVGLLHLSSGELTIGNNCFIGPNAHFYTPNHAIDDVELRRAGWQYDLPITLGDDVWLGGDVTVVPGVTIGSNVVVGAGSVVSKDVPDNCVVAGNPARIVKRLEGSPLLDV